MISIAIYSRKSIFTNKGDSIENQIKLCKTYCENYFQNDKLQYTIYEDEGFSGKNTNRPQFQNLISDIKQKKINILICYRLDRISRNVAHFSTTLELLQKYNVSFISIKEKFDTSIPMGRAMIYIASVFAQLERETIAERVKDNMLQLSKTGRWLGGTIPFGFNIEKITYLNNELKEKTISKLIPNESEIITVRFIYDMYLKHNSIRKVTKLLNTKLIKSKNGGNFDLIQVRRILRNPLYVKSTEETHSYLKNKGMKVFGVPNGNGYITYNKKRQQSLLNDMENWIVTVSNHNGIICADMWLKIQSILDLNKLKSPRYGTGKNKAIFSGLLKCAKCKSNMVIKYSGKNKNNLPYEYYVCNKKENKFINKCTSSNLSVDKINSLIIPKIKINNKDILLRSLEDYLKCKYNYSNDNDIKNIQAEIYNKEIESSNLIKQLSKSKSETLSKRIVDELNDLDTNINKLNEQLNLLNSKRSSTVTNSIDVNLIVSSLPSFEKTISLIQDITQKRLIAGSIIDTIYWDSDNSTLEIVFNSK